MSRLDALGEATLRRALFAGEERWGWEYREPGAASEPFPYPRPVPYLPWPDWAPELASRQARAGGQRAAMIVAGAFALLLGLLIAGWQPDLAVGLLAAGGTVGYLGATHPQVVRRQAEATHSRWLAECAAAQDRYQRALRAWSEAREAHRRRPRPPASAAGWVALRPSEPGGRVDVHGGTAAGWEALVTTAGAAMLGAGARLTVVDLSQRQVSAELRQLAERHGIATEAPRPGERLEDLAPATGPASGLRIAALPPRAQAPAGDDLAELLLRLIDGEAPAPRRVLLVIGADPLRRGHLERLARLARERGVRLVQLFAHLREDAIEQLGRGATLFMRLGDPLEAASAARLAGSGRRLSPRPLARAAGPPSAQRIADAVVERRLLQSLPETAFLLVETDMGGRRRVLLGDCDPGILTLPPAAAPPAG